MTGTPSGDGKVPAEQPTFMVKVGGIALTGAAGAVTLIVVLALMIWGVVASRPSGRMLLTAALWIAFVAYWSVAAKNAAPSKSTESVASRRFHQNLLNISLLLLFVPVPGLRGRFEPLATAVVVTGFALQTSGFLLAFWARRHLGRNWSGAITIAVDHQLVRSGPYRKVRHPIYTAMLMMYAGTTVVSGESHALLALAIVVGAYWRKMRLEERNLRDAFGGDYDEYCSATWALVPGLF